MIAYIQFSLIADEKGLLPLFGVLNYYVDDVVHKFELHVQNLCLINVLSIPQKYA